MASQHAMLEVSPIANRVIPSRQEAMLESCWQISSGAEGDRYAIEILARHIALADGYPRAEAVSFAYAASELASNLARHGGGGTLRIAAESDALTIEARNQTGNGLLLAGRGNGLEGVQRTMDEVELIDDDGTLVVVARRASKYVVSLASGV